VLIRLGDGKKFKMRGVEAAFGELGGALLRRAAKSLNNSERYGRRGVKFKGDPTAS
jgi:hypothetical protein